METLIINIPDEKRTLVKQLLKELGVSMTKTSGSKVNEKTPNKLTIKTINDANNGVGLNEPIKDISNFIDSL